MNGEVGWCSNEYSDMGESLDFDKFLAKVDAIFYGRISCDFWGQFQPEVAPPPSVKNLWAKAHSKKKYVFSCQAASDGKVDFIAMDFIVRVTEIKNQSGKNIRNSAIPTKIT